MNHQDIIDRREALRLEEGQAYKAERARIRKEMDSLRELCGGLGHIYAIHALSPALGGRYCVFCDAGEPKP